VLVWSSMPRGSKHKGNKGRPNDRNDEDQAPAASPAPAATAVAAAAASQWPELAMDDSGERLDVFVAKALRITRSRGARRRIAPRVALPRRKSRQESLTRSLASVSGAGGESRERYRGRTARQGQREASSRRRRPLPRRRQYAPRLRRASSRTQVASFAGIAAGAAGAESGA
jgi:hypothetical protein